MPTRESRPKAIVIFIYELITSVHIRRGQVKSACQRRCMDCVLKKVSVSRAPKIAFNYLEKNGGCRCYSESQDKKLALAATFTEWKYCRRIEQSNQRKKNVPIGGKFWVFILLSVYLRTYNLLASFTFRTQCSSRWCKYPLQRHASIHGGHILQRQAISLLHWLRGRMPARQSEIRPCAIIWNCEN